MSKSFEDLMLEFQRHQPSEIQTQRWKRALRRTPPRVWTVAAAALVAGILIGGVAMRQWVGSDENSNFSATYETIEINNL